MKPADAKPPSRPIEIKLKPYDPNYIPVQFGLNNTGVICWFNALVQMMLGLPSFNELMLENKSILEHNKLAHTYITAAENLLPNSEECEITEGSYSGLSIALLRALVETSSGANITPALTAHLASGQQCAAEGFTMFLQTLDNKSVDELFYNTYKQTITCERCKCAASFNKDISNCIRVPPTKDFRSKEERDAWKIYVAGLPFEHPHRNVIKNFKSQYKFQKWIHSHTADAYGFTCPKCDFKMVKVARREVIGLLMDVIVISFDMYNRIDPTWYPQEMLFGCSDKVSLVKYRLVGRICWSGTAALHNGAVVSSGHYWAHSVRRSWYSNADTGSSSSSGATETWYCLNDNSVSAGSPLPDKYTVMLAYHYVEKIPIPAKK
jgi:ubiquitin C-terminal hydrolase